MGNKVYIKEGVGLEGISMMQGSKPNKTRRFVILIAAIIFIISITLLGLRALGASEEVQEGEPAITILPTSSRDNETEPTTAVSLEPTKESKITPSVTQKVTPTVTPRVSPTANTLQLEVLNGSGVKGAAGEVSALLEEAGYTVVRTGNADAYTYTGITLNSKQSKQKQIDQLKKDLSANDYIVKKSETTLSESQDVDGIIIVGAEE